MWRCIHLEQMACWANTNNGGDLDPGPNWNLQVFPGLRAPLRCPPSSHPHDQRSGLVWAAINQPGLRPLPALRHSIAILILMIFAQAANVKQQWGIISEKTWGGTMGAAQWVIITLVMLEVHCFNYKHWLVQSISLLGRRLHPNGCITVKEDVFSSCANMWFMFLFLCTKRLCQKFTSLLNFPIKLLCKHAWISPHSIA